MNDFKIGQNSSNNFQLNPLRSAPQNYAESKSQDTTENNSEAVDKVSISPAGKAKSVAANEAKLSTEAESTPASKEDELIAKIQQQIKELKAEIEKLMKEPEENKELISAKQNQLMQLQGQLNQLLMQKAKNEGASNGGGTRAQGYKNSLT